MQLSGHPAGYGQSGLDLVAPNGARSGARSGESHDLYNPYKEMLIQESLQMSCLMLSIEG